MNKSFVELLQVSVGTRTVLSHPFSEEEWKELFAEAKKQGLAGVLFGGIERLPKEQVPPYKLLLEWIGLAELLKHKNEVANKRCQELTTKLSDDGFYSCILKGQANATYYPRPELRTCGDIDIWVSPKQSVSFDEDRKAVARYVIDRENDYIRMQYHHIDYHVFSDIEVEVHFCPMVLFNYWKNQVLQNKFKEEKNFCFQNWNDQKSFCTLTYMPNVLMQLVHMYRHVFDGGIGLKQVLDFYYLLVDIQKKQGQLASDQLKHDIEEIGMTHFCGGVCYVIDQLLLNGSDSSLLLVSPNPKHGKLLLRELEKWSQKRDHTIVTRGRRSKINHFFGSIVNNSRLWCYYPSDCAWNIFYRLSQYSWRMRNGWK